MPRSPGQFLTHPEVGREEAGAQAKTPEPRPSFPLGRLLP